MKVLAGECPDGTTWVLTSAATDRGLTTTIRRQRGAITAKSGFAGAPLPEGKLINCWSGGADGLPTFVVVRVDPVITEVVAVGVGGGRYPVQLSAIVPEFGLRFGAAVLRDGDELAQLETVPTNSAPITVQGSKQVDPREDAGTGWRPAGA